MMQNISFNIARFVIALFVAACLFSCASAKRDEKFYERQEEKQARMEQQEYEKKVKIHKKMQSKSTLKMMKQAERESKKYNKYKKR
jgi:hypothetical protein